MATGSKYLRNRGYYSQLLNSLIQIFSTSPNLNNMRRTTSLYENYRNFSQQFPIGDIIR